MKSTCRDFWKMVYDRKCGTVVALSELRENGTVIVHLECIEMED